MKKSLLKGSFDSKPQSLLKFLLSFIFLISLVLPTAAYAEIKTPPAPANSIYVQDYAGVLRDETKAKINNLGAEIDSKTKAQIVVLTIKSLEGQQLEDYSLAVLRKWAIGDSGLNNGVLLLIAQNDRKSRIEVGYGLEGALNDAKTGAIQDNYLIPYLKKGDYDQGVFNSYQVLAGVVAKEYNLAKLENAEPSAADSQNSFSKNENDGQEDGLPGWAQILLGIGILILLIIDWAFFDGSITLLILSLLRSQGKGGGGRGGYGGGSGGGGGSSRNW